MEFIWTTEDTNYAEQEIWKALKNALTSDDGICYHRYPIFRADRSRREPDILLLHRQWGMYVIECKGFNIDNIEKIEGNAWFMKNWHKDRETPYAQAEDQMFAILSRFKSESVLRKGRHEVVQGHVFIGLPFISRAAWKEKGLDLSPASPLTIIFSEDLEAEALRSCLQNVPAEEKQDLLTEEQWKTALGILQGTPAIKRESRSTTGDPNTRSYMLQQVEQQLQSMDREQQKIAIQIPSGPQRIRGLAGSGKTVVMSMKAAYMHLRYPSWDIAYTFYTRSLYDQIRGYITRFYRYWSDQDPDWKKLHVLHGWGGKDAPGIYSLVANKMRLSSRSYGEAKNIFVHREYSALLGNCCREILDGEDEPPKLFDAILMDEAQDFHFDFYKLCLSILNEPKRLIWAYDEVQSLESLSIPTAIDIFGTYLDGTPVVNLEGTYPDGDIEKDMILYRCYRNPRPTLIAAHIFGMGLLRSAGAVQFIPTSGGWEDIGYEIVSWDSQPGKEVTIRRPEQNSPHALEKLAGYQNIIQWKSFSKREDEIKWIASQMEKDINDHKLKPEDIVVISLDWRNMRDDFPRLQTILMTSGIQSVRVGQDIDKGIFQKPDCVTLTGIFAAKGNEGSVVYVMGFEQVCLDKQIIVQDRNQAFTAMTRSRGWCILTGIGGMAESSFKEIEQILSKPGEVTFKVPDPQTVQRNLDNLEYERRRNRIKKATDLARKLAQLLEEIDDPELRQKTIEQLGGSV